MSATVTYKISRLSIDNFIEGLVNDPIYFVASRGLPWPEPDEDRADGEGNDINSNEVPTVPLGIEKFINEFRKHAVFAKRINRSDVQRCVRRFDWESDKIYTAYDNNIDQSDHRSWLSPVQPYYVLVENRVYKCVDNGMNYDGEPQLSTVQPEGTLPYPVLYQDGYKWQFMFTINPTLMLNFVTDNWFVIPEGADYTQIDENKLLQEATLIEQNRGNVHYIKVSDGGANIPAGMTVRVIGDGQGAQVKLHKDQDVVEWIEVTHAGYGYTWARLEFDDLGQRDPDYEIVIGPRLAHGSDPVSELNSTMVMIFGSFVQAEGSSYHTYNQVADNFSTWNIYRSVGLWGFPADNSRKTADLVLDPNAGIITAETNDGKLPLFTRLHYANDDGDGFKPGQTIKVTSIANDDDRVVYSEISASVLYNIDLGTNGILYINNTAGEFRDGDEIEGYNAGSDIPDTTATIIDDGDGDPINSRIGLEYPINVDKLSGAYDPYMPDSPDVVDIFSGDVYYIENMIPVVRKGGQTEIFRFIIEF